MFRARGDRATRSDGAGFMKGWTLHDIPWDRFDRSRVDPEILRVVKAAAMVEGNGGDYAAYLCNVFHDDPAFQQVARHWGGEEIQHGAALGRWAELADPGFDFAQAFRRFSDGFKINLATSRSIRGSRSGELVARCIVETGTSSYYTALMEAVDEPVLKEICRNIAADELRHYKLFYTHLKRYLEQEKIGAWRRVLVALGRLREAEDDELAVHACDLDATRFGKETIFDFKRHRRIEHYGRITSQVGVELPPEG